MTSALLATLLAGALLFPFYVRARAQSNGGEWSEPLNLSHSGAASTPALVLGPDGTLRVFWWDRFDGLMVRQGPTWPAEEAAWSEAEAITVYEPIVEQEEIVLEPVEAMPTLVGDGGGYVHALWLGQADEETGQRPLLHSYLGPGGRAWSYPVTIASSASQFVAMADPAAGLHLAYVRPQHTSASPAGVYYRRLARGGGSWGTARLLHSSFYYRLTSTGDDSPPAEGSIHLRLALEPGGGAIVTWDDPHLGQATLAYSADGGQTWMEAIALGGQDVTPRQARALVLPGGATWLLWEDPRVQGTCALYQEPLAGRLAGTPETAGRAAEGWTVCPGDARLWPLDGQGTLMVAGYGEDALTLSLLSAPAGEIEWSDLATLSFHFADPELGQEVQLQDLQAILAAPGTEDGGVERLVVAGSDGRGEVWLTSSPVDRLVLDPSRRPLATPTAAEGSAAEETPVPAVNLSHSGAASQPALATGPDNSLYAFWWDRFDGLMVAQGQVLTSSGDRAEAVSSHGMWAEPRAMSGPFPAMPRLLVDAAGRVHAFWSAEEDDSTAGRPLMYSRALAQGGPWSGAVPLADAAAGMDVAVDASGTLHLVYLRTAHTTGLPAGVYYRHSDDGGLIWSSPVGLYASVYYRLFASDDLREDVRLRLAAGEGGELYVTWDDPQRGQALWSRSGDGGMTWQAPESISDPSGRSRRARVVLLPGGEAWLQWEDPLAGESCALYQRHLTGDPSPGAVERVLSDLAICPQGERLLPAGEGQVLMVSGGGDVLTLALWDGTSGEGAWSEPRMLYYSFQEPGSGRWVSLDELQAGLAERPAQDGAPGDGTLVALGVDGAGDVWTTGSPLGALGILLPSAAPWTGPQQAWQGETLPGALALAVDLEGTVHALWSEALPSGAPGTALYYARASSFAGGEVQWSRPTQVLHAAGAGMAEPALASAGDRLHAVWSSGPGGQILYSSAFLDDAYAAEGWGEPLPLPAPAPAGSWPDLAVDRDGTLHVVYAVPLNEGRGVYYTRSQDGGQTWSAADQVFDAARAGWEMVDYPRLAVYDGDNLHVVWVQATLPGKGLPQGIYYAHSLDGGLSWLEALPVAEGPYAWPQVAVGAQGQAHLLWQEVGGQDVWWHQWSSAPPEPVPGFSGAPGPVRWLSDGAGTFYLLGLGRDEAGEPALLYAAWEEAADGWTGLEARRLRPGEEAQGSPGAALDAQRGQLDVAFAGQAVAGESAGQVSLWHARRAVPAVEPPPPPTPTPTPPPTPTATPPPTPTPRPTVNLDAPPPDTMPALGPLDAPLSILGGGLVAAAVVAALLFARSWWVRRP